MKKYQLRTMSPVFIGSGHKYSGMEWLAGNGFIHFFDWPQIEAWITENNVSADDFVTYIENCVSELESAERIADRNQRNQEKSRLRVNLSLEALALKFTPQKDLRKYAAYRLGVAGGIPQKGGDIYQFIRNVGDAYIPGTEIKGAIRTAVLYDILLADNGKNGENLANQLKNLLNNNKNSIDALSWQKEKNSRESAINNLILNEKKIIKSLLNELEKLSKDFVKNNLQSGKDAHYDLLRQLEIGDSQIIDPEKTLMVAQVNVWYMDNGEKTRINIPMELMDCEVILPLTGFYAWEDGNRTHKSQLNVHLGGVKGILQTCYNFTNDLLDEEIKAWRNVHSIGQAITKGLQELKNANKPEAPLIRLGGSEGLLSTTVCLWLKRNGHEDLVNKLIGPLSKGKSYTNMFPKTRRCVQIDGKWHTLGWVRIEPLSEKAEQINRVMPQAVPKDIPSGPKQGDILQAVVDKVEGLKLVLKVEAGGQSYTIKADKPYGYDMKPGQAARVKVIQLGGDGRVKEIKFLP